MLQVLVLKQSFIDIIKKNERLKLQIAEANDHVKMITVDRWLARNDTFLTTATNLEILKKHFEVLETAELLERKTIEEVAS
jgi:hypothetical protein